VAGEASRVPSGLNAKNERRVQEANPDSQDRFSKIGVSPTKFRAMTFFAAKRIGFPCSESVGGFRLCSEVTFPYNRRGETLQRIAPALSGNGGSYAKNLSLEIGR
jgi:hypothetical protein